MSAKLTETQRRPWPRCGGCGKELILQNVHIGYCNIQCEQAHRAEFVAPAPKGET